MDKELKFLREWAVRYVKNKDLITKKITSIKENDNDFVITKGDKEYKLFIEPSLKEHKEILSKVKDSELKTVVCFHTKENFSVLLNNWDDFVKAGRNFTIYFVNPFSKMDKILILCPYTHQLISDDDSLKLGLKTMAETVEFTSDEEIDKIVNS